MSKLKNSYNSLGQKTKIVLKSTLLLALPLLLASIFSDYAHFTPFHYELLLISDELSATARAILSTGFIGTFAFNLIEKSE